MLQGHSFTIGADLDEAVLKAIESIPEWEWESYKTGHIAETVHCMNRTEEAFRLIIVRRPYQGKLFGDEDKRLKYTAIATSMVGKAQEVLDWYNQRGECSENRIKDLKIGFGKEGESKRAYRQFIKKGVDQGRRPDLVGGGLIRSQGGW